MINNILKFAGQYGKKQAVKVLSGERERTPGLIQNSVRFSVIAAVTSIMRAMVIRVMVIGFFRRGSAVWDRSRPDIAGNTTAFVIFGISLSREGDRCPNRDEGCGGNDERLLHAASPKSNLALKCEERYPCHGYNGACGNYHRSWAKVPCLIG